jgi:PAS domain S-box-containing protein
MQKPFDLVEAEQRLHALEIEVTRRKEAEVALNEDKEWYQALAEVSPVGIFRTDAKGHCLYVNRRWCEISGLTPDEALGEGWIQAIHADDRDRVFTQWYDAARNNRPFQLEYRFQAPDGTITWVVGNAKAVAEPSGKILGYVGTITDITEHKRAEEDVFHLAAIVESSDDAIIGKTLGGIIRTWNPGAERIYGYPSGEAIGQPISILVPPDRPDEVPQILERIKRGERVDHFETVRKRKDGSPIDVSLSISPILDASGNVVGASTIARDITVHKRAQKEQALMRELGAKNGELEQFASRVAHNLKSPLTTINGFAGLMGQSAAAGDHEGTKAWAARISAAVDGMERLLDDLLELSCGGRRMHPAKEVRLAEAAQDAVSAVAGRLAQRGVRVEIAPDLPVVYGDAARLREVLECLLDNAAKFMGDQPDPRVEIGARRACAEVIVCVRDNGEGVAPRAREKIFELFERLHGGAEGRGMGLAIAKRIVEAHGGRIWVESNGLGKGASFCFALPGRKGQGRAARTSDQAHTRRAHQEQVHH